MVPAEADDDGVTAAVEGELALLDPAVRSSRARVEELLHPGFVEVGRSGRRWSRSEMVEALAQDLSLAGAEVVVDEVRGECLAGDVVHLTYRSTVDGATAFRSSLWRRTPGGWQLWFHQGTPLSSTAAGAPAGE
ncbi:hypothetical protein SAMN05660199_01675 [Klenkia soli]|uniref:DUF4440 domain-containing protein n=1 Tax=Klenkia soli TaxID=1052260 RepID=A0A1H0I406_9ACTN|nr:DUF4440 domain-containing protein [Klenkia soli]SDO26174.1 hypothetical protein SAMN05660199_01675 [Klenkia soli]